MICLLADSESCRCGPLRPVMFCFEQEFCPPPVNAHLVTGFSLSVRNGSDGRIKDGMPFSNLGIVEGERSGGRTSDDRRISSDSADEGIADRSPSSLVPSTASIVIALQATCAHSLHLC